MKIWLLLLLINLLLNSSTASAQSWLWGTEAIRPVNGHGEGEGWSVASDAAGNSYLTGSFNDTLNLGIYNLSTIYQQMFVIKYDSNGNVLWDDQSTNSSIRFSNSQANGVATDFRGNVYVTGFFFDTISFGLDTLFSHGDNVFLVKYDNNGNVLWARKSITPLGSNNGLGYAVATDKSGNVCITGTYTGSVIFGTDTLVSNKGFGIFYVKYDSSGNLIWCKQPVIGGTGGDIPRSIATDKFNNIYITGEISDSVIFGTTTLYLPPGQLQEVFLAKLDSNGNSLWAQQSLTFDQNNSEDGLVRGYNVNVDKSGNPYITGTYYKTIYFNSNLLVTNTYQNIFLIKYDVNGNVLWAKTSDVLKGFTHSSEFFGWTGYTILFDAGDNIFISAGGGVYVGTDGDEIVFGTDTITIPGQSTDGCSIILKLDSLGNVLCGVGLPGGGDDNNGIALGPLQKSIYFGGDLWTAIRLGPDSLPYENTEIPFMSRWQPCNECDIAVTIAPQSVSLCAGDSVTLTASGGINYTWNPSIGLSATTGSSVIASPVTNVTYTVSVTDSAGCGERASDTITVSIPPGKPIISQHGDTIISSATQGNQWVRNDTLLTGATNQTYIVTISGYYKVITENPANGCSTASDTGYYTPAGIDWLIAENERVTVYPNPTSGEIMVTISPSAMDVNDWNLQITDVLGRTMYSKQSLNYNNAVDLSHLPSAMYFITVTNNTGKMVVPVVKVN